MSLICLYLDEDTIQGALIRAIRNSGVDVISTSESGKLGSPDEEQLIWATSQKRVIYSFNMGDFCRLHRSFMTEGMHHGGMILVPQQRYSIGEQLRGLLSLMEHMSAEEMMNQLIFLSNYIEKF
jgi:Domain of unknown function (DUF5615)